MILAVIYAIAYIEAWKIQDFNAVWTRASCTGLNLSYRCREVTGMVMQITTVFLTRLYIN